MQAQSPRAALDSWSRTARDRSDVIDLITAFHNTRYRPLRLPSGHMLRLVLMFMRLRTAMAGRARPGS